MQKKQRKKERSKERRKKVSAPRKNRRARKKSLDDFEKCSVRRIFLKHYDVNRNVNLAQTSSRRKNTIVFEGRI
jgi:hypothetical protein